MALFSDDFNRSDGPLGSNWELVTTNGALSITSNRVSPNGGFPQWARWYQQTDGVPSFSEADVDMDLPSTEYSLFVNSDGNWSWPHINGYRLYVFLGSGIIRLFRASGGSGEQMGDDGAWGVSGGLHRFRLEHDGSGNVHVFADDVLAMTRVDAVPLTDRYVGFGWESSWNGDGLIDNWAGGDLGGVEPPVINTTNFFQIL